MWITLYMICRQGGLIIQRHNKLMDLEAEIHGMKWCRNQTSFEDITGEDPNRGAKSPPDALLDILARGFWERQRSTFFEVRVCHPIEI